MLRWGAMVLGDFKVENGAESENGPDRSFELCMRNENSKRLFQFCRKKHLIITNNLYYPPSRWIFAWQSPAAETDIIVRIQKDFFLFREMELC